MPGETPCVMYYLHNACYRIYAHGITMAMCTISVKSDPVSTEVRDQNNQGQLIRGSPIQIIVSGNFKLRCYGQNSLAIDDHPLFLYITVRPEAIDFNISMHLCFHHGGH